ncbi:MAG: hypothetical protein ACPGWR_26215, partial [Ardenticatenaceae bacterium]
KPGCVFYLSGPILVLHYQAGMRVLPKNEQAGMRVLPKNELRAPDFFLYDLRFLVDTEHGYQLRFPKSL